MPGSEDQYADVERHPENQRTPGIVVLRVESGLFFANSDWVSRRVRREGARPATKALVIDAASIADLDVTAAEMLDQLADTLENDGVELLLARDIGSVRDVLRETGADEGLDRVYPSVRAAVEAAERNMRGITSS